MSEARQECPLRAALAALEPLTVDLLERFCALLAERSPAMERRLCRADRDQRRGILLNVIVLVAETHEELEAVQETLHRLGDRHRSQGIGRADFRVFGAVLRDAIAEVLQERWTPEADWLWRRSFRRVAAEMATPAS